VSWTVAPGASHAVALIRLDGADTALVHRIAASPDVRTGARVTARWHDERAGRIDDFEFVVDAGAPVTTARPVSLDSAPAVTTMDFFSSLTYTDVVSPTTQRYASALLEGRIIGQRCPECDRVYVAPRGYCPVDALALGSEHDVTLTQRGTVTTFTVITPVQYHGQKETEPFVRAAVLLDDCDALFVLQDIIGVPSSEVRVGMRVEAQWLAVSERTVDQIENRGWGNATGCIEGWRPTGEPDVPAEAVLDRVF
jgi:uncharacterized protein